MAGLDALSRTWAEGGPFPSQGRTIRRGTPLDRDADTAPQLRWTAARVC
jgi:hypothetical protein